MGFEKLDGSYGEGVWVLEELLRACVGWCGCWEWRHWCMKSRALLARAWCAMFCEVRIVMPTIPSFLVLPEVRNSHFVVDARLEERVT
jgi:hypothetical protein